jgi:hypothetical protein
MDEKPQKPSGDDDDDWTAELKQSAAKNVCTPGKKTKGKKKKKKGQKKADANKDASIVKSHVRPAKQPVPHVEPTANENIYLLNSDSDDEDYDLDALIRGKQHEARC